MIRLGLCLQDWNSSYPTGAVLEDIDDGKVIASDYCDTKEEFLEFVREHTDKVDQISISFSTEDLDSTAVLDFGIEVAREIKEKFSREEELDI